MSKVRDGSKERYWRGMIQRQGESGKTITRFCADERVSTHQFYWWRRALRARDQQATADPRTCDDGTTRQDETPGEAFVPVRLPILTQAPIELVHPGGWVLRVPTGFDPLSLRQVLATLDSDTGEN